VSSGYATRRRWREALGDDVVLRMNAARSPRAAGGASDVGEPARRMRAKPGRTGRGRRKNSKRAAKSDEDRRPGANEVSCCLGPDGCEVCRGKNRRRQAGVHTEGNMPPACRGAGSQSPWSSAGGSKELRSTNRRPTWRATVSYRARLLATVPYRARFAWARCA